jgi:hypothetical protein
MEDCYMGQLHEVLAARTKREEQAKQALSQAKKVFGAEHLFESFLQSYRHLEEDPSGLHREPPKSAHLTTTVGNVLAELRESVVPAIDINATIDLTNMAAMGKIEVEDLDLPQLPTTQMMALKKSIEQILAVLRAIPTHDPKHEWTEDAERGIGVYKTEPQVTYRTTKKVRHEVVVPPTKEHRAEIREFSEDVVTGEVTKRYWSGKLTLKQKTALLKKTEALLEAVGIALARANQIEAENEHIGRKLFGWLFRDIPLE